MPHFVPLFCAFWLIATAAAQAPGTPAQAAAGIAIRVLRGNGAINSIRLRQGHDPTVQVVDASGEPLANATVTFLLPSSGPGGVFGESGASVTLKTDQRGMAATSGLRPNGVPGQFRIRVTAAWRGEVAAATVTQTNAEPVKSSKSKKLAILAAVAGGAAAAIAVAATHGGGSSSTSSSTSSGAVTIVAGTPSIGPPH
jgi:hypothetical protein